MAIAAIVCNIWIVRYSTELNYKLARKTLEKTTIEGKHEELKRNLPIYIINVLPECWTDV